MNMIYPAPVYVCRPLQKGWVHASYLMTSLTAGDRSLVPCLRRPIARFVTELRELASSMRYLFMVHDTLLLVTDLLFYFVILSVFVAILSFALENHQKLLTFFSQT